MALKNTLTPYDESWPQKFIEEAKRLKAIFKNAAFNIHHVGSTSIPGIYAKPEIDIHIELENFNLIDNYSEEMQEIGYKVRGEEVEPRCYYYSKNINGVRTCKVHASETGHASLVNHLLFRNYLRANKIKAKEYSELKLRLAKSNKTGIIEYLDGKGPFIQNVIKLAKEKI